MRAAAWFLIIFGVCYLPPGLWMFREHQKIRSTWPAITAVSEGSRVVKGRYKRSDVYSTEFDLRYRVDGRDYVTPVVERGWTSSHSKANALAASHATGTRHTVWYDPSNPHSIRRDVGSLNLFFLPALFTGLGILLLGIGVFLYRRPVKERRCPSCGSRSVTPFCGYCGREQRSVKAQPPTTRDRRGSLIVGGVFGVLGLAMFGGSAWWMYRQFSIFESWPGTTGIVLDRQFERRNTRGKMSFESRVRFEYTADGVVRRNLSEPERSSNYGWIRKRFDRYEKGASMTIRYDPANPDRIRTQIEAELEPFLPFLIIGAMALIFMPLGYFLLAPALRPRRLCKECQQETGGANRYCCWCGASC